MKQTISSFVNTLLKLEVLERRAVIWAFVYFFTLLSSYYILRPIRDEMGVQGGVDQLQWLFSATFVAMLLVIPLFGYLCSRFPRRRFLPYAYYFFVANLVIFFLLFHFQFHPVVVARVFFVWVSVFNLFVVSVFWSLMVDVFSDEQGKRLFGMIAAGGSLGAICGPLLTGLLVGHLGKDLLLLLSAALLLLAVVCMKKIIRWSAQQNQDKHLSDHAEDVPMQGSVLDGVRLVFRSPYLMGICGLILLYTVLATFLYLQQAQIVKEAFDSSEQRTAVFAWLDFGVNALTLIFQIFITSRIVLKLGLAWSLALVPLFLAMGFAVLGFMPELMVLLVVQTIRRAGNYAIMKPAREMLYLVLDQQAKYKAKNFIDTTVYRGGDALSSWVYTGFKAMGLSLANIAFIAVPLTLIWAGLAYHMGRWQNRLSRSETSNKQEPGG